MWILLALRCKEVALADISLRVLQRSSIGLLLVLRTLRCSTQQRSVKQYFRPEIASALAKDNVAVLEPFFKKLQENTTQGSILGRGRWVHGATTSLEYFKIFQAYSLADVARDIQCPTFVAEAENDRRRGGGKDLFNALQRQKEFVLFTASEGAGEHCEAGGREVFF